METRKIMIANTRTQKRNELMTDATTLGELKAAMDAAGIDYSDMTFTEGISKTQLISNDSLLPTNVKYKGEVTNDLVILLTNTHKKVASGCFESRTRRDAYDIINENEWMKEAIKDEFGANYTLITTENLWLFIDKNLEDEDEEDTTEEDTTEEDNSQSVAKCIYNLMGALAKSETLNRDELLDISQYLKDIADSMSKTYNLGGAKISDDEIDDMIASI